MEIVPNEIIQKEIMYQLSAKDLIQMCQVSKQFKILCDNEKLWEDILKRDFPQHYNSYSTMTNVNWKKVVIHAVHEKEIYSDLLRKIKKVIPNAYIKQNDQLFQPQGRYTIHVPIPKKYKSPPITARLIKIMNSLPETKILTRNDGSHIFDIYYMGGEYRLYAQLI